MSNKLILIFLFVALSSSQVFAQYNSKSSKNISRFRPGTGWFFTGIRPATVDKVRKYDRLIFDITYNDFIGDLAIFEIKPTSIGFGTNFMFDVPLTKGNTVAFGWGLGFKHVALHHNNAFVTNKESTEYHFTNSNTFSSLKYNTFYVPIEMRFRKESWRHFKIHLGGKIGYNAQVFNKTKLITPTGKTVIKDYQFPDLNPLNYAVHVRLGLRNYSLFGEYGLSKLFTNPTSTQVSVVRMGISISLY
jgi:hypothetical protein